MDKKNYYKILNLDEGDKKLPKDDFLKKLKNNYRLLCRQWHPDKCHDESKKQEYEEKFKEIAEAYSVLSDENKRAEYDNPNVAFNSNFSGFGSFEDIMKEFGNFGFGSFGNFSTKKKVNKGQSIRITIGVTLNEIFNGVKKLIKYKRHIICQDCHGSGMTDKSKKETCPHCGGTGQLFSQNGAWQTITTCHYCNGTGEIIKNPCPKCKGHGVVEDTNQIEVNIPKGVVNGMQLVFKGMGSEIPNGISGDLIVVVKEIEDNKFYRDGTDIYTEIEVPVLDLLLEKDVTVETINHKKLKFKLPVGVEDGYKMRFVGHGMPIYETNQYGNMYGIIKIKMPKKISKDEKTILSSLQDHDNFK